MATKTQQKPTSKSHEVARRSNRSVPAGAAVKSGGGRGLSNTPDDSLVPLIYVLQPLSPQVDKKKPQHIPGAEAGQIWLRNAPKPLRDEIIAQPCHFYKEVLEWIPRKKGGGFVARHDSMPDWAKEKPDPDHPKRQKWINPENGNELIAVRAFVVMVYDSVEDEEGVPYVISLSSSGHSVGRQWMFMQNRKTLPGGKKADSFACLYRLRTKQRSNAEGTWYVLDPEDILDNDGEPAYWASDRQFRNGESLHAAFSSGEKKAAAPDEVHDEGAEDETGEI